MIQHFGGLWDSAVKTIRRHLMQVHGAPQKNYVVHWEKNHQNFTPLTAPAPSTHHQCHLPAPSHDHFLVRRLPVYFLHPELNDDTQLVLLNLFKKREVNKFLFSRRWGNEELTKMQHPINRTEKKTSRKMISCSERKTTYYQ